MGVPTIGGRGWRRVTPLIRTIRAATMARAMRIRDLWGFMADTDGGHVTTVVFMVLAAVVGVVFGAERVLNCDGNKNPG